jgi:hypothetical protein
MNEQRDDEVKRVDGWFMCEVRSEQSSDVLSDMEIVGCRLETARVDGCPR